jgi:hypothetical protein
MSFYPGGTSNFSNDPSVPTGDGTIDLANVQGLKVVDGQISVYNNTPGNKISSIELSAGTEAAGSPSCSLTCSVPESSVATNITLSRINFPRKKEPVDIIRIYEAKATDNYLIDNNVYVIGSLMPTVIGDSRVLDSAGPINLQYRYPRYGYISLHIGTSSTVNLTLEVLPPLGNTFVTFCDYNPTGSGLTRTFNVKGPDGTTYITITSTGLTRTDIVGILPESGATDISFDVISSPLSAAGSFTVPVAGVNKMKENAEKIRKGDYAF